MDKFSHDLSVALEETSVLFKGKDCKFGQRRRTPSTGNLPCPPQPTEHLSSNPADLANSLQETSNVDGLSNKLLPSDSDDKNDLKKFRLTTDVKSFLFGTIESDSFNENFSPARFMQLNIRRKRKFKRMPIGGERGMHCEYLSQTSTTRKRVLKSSIFFSGKRKRSSKDCYLLTENARFQLSGVCAQNVNFCYDKCKRPATPQHCSDRIPPLNKCLVSEIEKNWKLHGNFLSRRADLQKGRLERGSAQIRSVKSDIETQIHLPRGLRGKSTATCRKKSVRLKREELKLQFALNEQISMECGELYNISTSSSLSSSESDCEHINDTDRDGDDELTDWPSSEKNFLTYPKNDIKRKLTKRQEPSLVQFAKTEKFYDGTHMAIDDLGKNTYELRFQASKPIAMQRKVAYLNCLGKDNLCLKHLESEMPGETSNTFLHSPHLQTEVREIRAGCRRITVDRPGFSIKTSTNERLARFLQDAKRTQIRLPDIGIHEHESLLNLSKLYSLNMYVDRGCAVFTKTRISNNSSAEMYEQNGFSPKLLALAAVLTFIIMAVGIFGNFLTVVALLRCPKVRNVAAAFIISLCLADLIFCALVLPFSALRFIEGTWTHGNVLCKLIPFIQYGNIGVSLLCIAMITINRYVMIAHHNTYTKLYKRQWIAAMIMFCWLFSYGMQLPTLLGLWGVFDYDPKLGTCSIMNDANGRSSKTTLFITAFFIPCLIIIACYTKIFWVVHKSEMRLKNHAHKQNSVPNNQRHVAQAPNMKAISNVGSESSFSMDIKQGCLQQPTRVKDLRAKRNEWRITKMVLAIFLSFLVCYLPITLAKVADKDVNQPAFHIFSYIMLYLSACINPIIYVIMNKQYRKAYKTVLMCEPSRLLPFVKPGNSAAEKWKDIGLNHNHSRTMVSQMSSSDPQSTSFSYSQMPTKEVETAIKSGMQIAVSSPTPNVTSATKRLEIGTNSPRKPGSVRIVGTTEVSTQQLRDLPATRVEPTSGRIITEEEAEAQKLTRSVAKAKARCLNELNSVKIGNQKKIQSYGQNINVTPVNNSKLITKLKM